MHETTLLGLEDVLIDYMISELDNYVPLPVEQRQKIKALKLVVSEYKEGEFCLTVSIGIAEVRFAFNGDKIAGSIKGEYERLIRRWMSRPLIQAKLNELTK